MRLLRGKGGSRPGSFLHVCLGGLRGRGISKGGVVRLVGVFDDLLNAA